MATTPMDDLLVIQEKDRRLARLGQEGKDIPLRKKELDHRLDAHRYSLEQAQEDLKRILASVKETEGEIDLINGKIRKYKEQQFQIKNNDEYRALEHEIEKAGVDISGLEDKQLALMGQTDEVKKRIEEIQRGMKADEARIAVDVTQLDERDAVLKEQLESLIPERAKLAERIPVDMLSKYERIMNHLKDRAIVPIENGSCGGCHMNLPPQVVNDA
ncbi:MAG: hypothetical protein PHG65_08795, partial [Kiritimatiellae bacterium]|nr:hypothetical protein [Kiritimatiellia bacterium]